MKKGYITTLILALILIIAVLTNPSQDLHKEAVKTKLNSYMQKSISERLSESDNEWKQAGQALGMMFGGALIDEFISNAVSIDNYVVFSTTKVTWERETKVIGIGFLGNVFLTSKIDETLDRELLSQ